MRFDIGNRYSSVEIQTALGVGNAGGVRVALDDFGVVRRLVVMTSVPSARAAAENPYHDRIENDYLIYTGAGREGDQILAGVNKRIPQQLDVPFPVYGFLLIGSRRDQSLGDKRWQFLGLLEYVRHYTEQQLDVRRELRRAWIFEFRIHSESHAIDACDDGRRMREILAMSSESSRDVPDEREIGSPSGPGDPHPVRADAVEIESTRRHLLMLAPIDFEGLIRDVLSNVGFQNVSTTRYSQDGGIDVNAYLGDDLWPVKGLQLQVQAKRWLHTVGRREVAELRGSLRPFARGAVVTTSHFSRAAVREASEAGKNPIVLVDGYSLAKTVNEIRANSPNR